MRVVRMFAGGLTCVTLAGLPATSVKAADLYFNPPEALCAVSGPNGKAEAAGGYIDDRGLDGGRGHVLGVIDARPGAEAALARVPALIGLADEPWALPSGHHPRLDELARRHPGLRLVNTGDVFEALLVTVPQQLVTWQEAVAGWRRLVEKAGSPAPLGLIASPTAAQVRRLSLHDVVGCGIARRRAETILRCARVAGRLQQAASMPTPAAMERLMAVPGVGPWTAASVLGQRLGRPDVIIEGDVHLPNTVAYGLTGQARADDPAMRRILAPYAGQEMRVVLLLMAGGVSAPKRGPRRAPGWR